MSVSPGQMHPPSKEWSQDDLQPPSERNPATERSADLPSKESAGQAMLRTAEVYAEMTSVATSREAASKPVPPPGASGKVAAATISRRVYLRLDYDAG